MTADSRNPVPPGEAAPPESVEMPTTTPWPLFLAVACTFVLSGFVTSWAFSIVGVIIFVIALAFWIGQLRSGHGHYHEEFVTPEARPQPVRPHLGEVESLQPGMPGHRFRVPEQVHPYSAGALGGIIGGAAMTIPALLYGLFSQHHSLWYPINLLVGMVLELPRLPDGSLNIEYLQQFHFSYFVLATFIHVLLSVCLGLMYGVLLPMLPGRPLLFGGVVAPLLWTGLAYGFMGVLNPALRTEVWWPAFFLSQFVFGVVVAQVVVRSEKVYTEPAGAGPVGPNRPAAPTGGSS
jgi:hypothetical protein